MKTNLCHRRNQAFTAFEVLVIVAVLLLLVALLLPHRERVRRSRSNTHCINNLMQIDIDFRVWEGDNSEEYPGGAMDLIATSDVASCFLAMSNQLSSPRILVCPEDTAHTTARDFGPGFDRTHISYFVNVDVTNNGAPRMIVDGDDDLIVGGRSLKSGVSELSTNASVWWSGSRHSYGGYLGFADGSVRETADAELPQIFVETAVATNRLAIP